LVAFEVRRSVTGTVGHCWTVRLLYFTAVRSINDLEAVLGPSPLDLREGELATEVSCGAKTVVRGMSVGVDECRGSAECYEVKVSAFEARAAVVE
jgi:hypothetical protein